MTGARRPRHTVERQPDGWVVVDWREGRSVSRPVAEKAFADGHADQLNRRLR